MKSTLRAPEAAVIAMRVQTNGATSAKCAMNAQLITVLTAPTVANAQKTAAARVAIAAKIAQNSATIVKNTAATVHFYAKAAAYAKTAQPFAVIAAMHAANAAYSAKIAKCAKIAASKAVLMQDANTACALKATSGITIGTTFTKTKNTIMCLLNTAMMKTDIGRFAKSAHAALKLLPKSTPMATGKLQKLPPAKKPD